MTEPDRIARIRAYVERHRNTYHRDALRRWLIAEGYTAEDVDQVMAEVYADEAENMAASEKLRSISLSNAVAVLNMVFMCFALYIVVPFFVSEPFAGDYRLLLGGFILSVLPLVIEGAAAWILRNRNPTVSYGLKWGAILSATWVAFGVLLVGICVATSGYTLS